MSVQVACENSSQACKFPLICVRSERVSAYNSFVWLHLQPERFESLARELVELSERGHATEEDMQTEFEAWAHRAAQKLGLHFARSRSSRGSTDGLFLTVRA